MLGMRRPHAVDLQAVVGISLYKESVSITSFIKAKVIYLKSMAKRSLAPLGLNMCHVFVLLFNTQS